jgi:hypothetical protein
LIFLDFRLLLTPLVSSDYPFGVFCLPLWCLLITPLVSSDYPFGIFWLPLWYLLITPLVSSDYPFGIFWLLLWYLLITPLVSSDHPFGIFKLFAIFKSSSTIICSISTDFTHNELPRCDSKQSECSKVSIISHTLQTLNRFSN